MMMKSMLHAHCPGVFGTRLKASSVGKMGFQFLNCHTRCQRWFQKVLMKNTGVRFQEVERRERDMWSAPLLCEPWEHQRVQVGLRIFLGSNHDPVKVYLPSVEMEKGHFSDFPRTGFLERSFAQFGEKLPLSESANLLPSVLGPPNMCLIWVEIKNLTAFGKSVFCLNKKRQNTFLLKPS